MKQLTKVSYEQISVQIDKNLLKKIDAMARKLNLSRNQLVRNLIDSGFDDAVMLDRIGLLKAVQFGQKIISKLKKGVATGRITFDKEGELEIKDREKE